MLCRAAHRARSLRSPKDLIAVPCAGARPASLRDGAHISIANHFEEIPL